MKAVPPKGNDYVCTLQDARPSWHLLASRMYVLWCNEQPNGRLIYQGTRLNFPAKPRSSSFSGAIHRARECIRSLLEPERECAAVLSDCERQWRRAQDHPARLGCKSQD